MKNKFLKTVLLATLFLGVASSCVNDDDFDIPALRPIIYSENFNEIDYNMTFDYADWTNFAEAGTKKWIEREFRGDGYIQFSSFGSGESSNIGWAISPAMDMDAYTGEVLTFKSATNFVDNPANKLEVFVSSDYDGTNVLAATWTQVDAVVADETTNGYTYVSSGNIDLSSYTGTLHVAFKVTGNGTSLDGLFQVDKIVIYSSN